MGDSKLHFLFLPKGFSFTVTCLYFPDSTHLTIRCWIILPVASIQSSFVKTSVYFLPAVSSEKLFELQLSNVV